MKRFGSSPPSPESLFRHALYGIGFFQRELGVTSRDIFLPDCFGFPFALVTILAVGILTLVAIVVRVLKRRS